MMHPAVISAPLACYFSFWANDNIQAGMRHGRELYYLVASFPNEHRHKAYSLGNDLCRHNQQVVITCSGVGYDVWVSLRSPQLPDAERSISASEIDLSA